MCGLRRYTDFGPVKVKRKSGSVPHGGRRKSAEYGSGGCKWPSVVFGYESRISRGRLKACLHLTCCLIDNPTLIGVQSAPYPIDKNKKCIARAAEHISLLKSAATNK